MYDKHGAKVGAVPEEGQSPGKGGGRGGGVSLPERDNFARDQGLGRLGIAIEKLIAARGFALKPWLGSSVAMGNGDALLNQAGLGEIARVRAGFLYT